MKKVIRDNYPVPELPEALREGLPPDHTVKVTTGAEASPELQEGRMTFDELFALARPSSRTMEETISEIRQQRDEWDDRLGR